MGDAHQEALQVRKGIQVHAAVTQDAALSPDRGRVLRTCLLRAARNKVRGHPLLVVLYPLPSLGALSHDPASLVLPYSKGSVVNRFM